MGGGKPKQFRALRGIPVFIRAIMPFQAANCVKAICVVVSEEYLHSAREMIEKYHLDKVVRIVKGGHERQHSVQSGLVALEDRSADIVVIHDGARPLVTEALIEDVVMAAYTHGAAVPVLPLPDTVKLVGEGTVVRSLARSHLRLAQTPQAFHPSLLKEAYERHGRHGATDDAWLVEECGYPVHTVEGRTDNLKLTCAEDWVVADKLLDDGSGPRVGMGYDVHRLAASRPLILGGIRIPSDLGLDGHSDADVLVHAVIDAMLGALALPDIGQQFPDSDPAYRGVDSCVLLDRTNQLLRRQGWYVSNVDCTLAAESPRLSPFIAKMRAKLAGVLRVEEEQVGIKATTTEGLGFVGQREGICAWSVVMIRQIG